jgi:bidirectional [NiFe] hydrogenase diaphorase subunit
MIRLTVDGKEIRVEKGRSLLQACLENGIYIPNLCYMETIENQPASCRLCFVEVEGRNGPVASCKVAAVPGMVVKTDTEKVRRLQRTALRLLLSVHEAQCKACPSNKKCELQRMTKFLGVRLRPRRLEHIERDIASRTDDPCFEFVPGRCVLCGKCIHVCKMENGRSYLTFAKRGLGTVLTTFGDDAQRRLRCPDCRACVDICPVSAILFKDLTIYK